MELSLTTKKKRLNKAAVLHLQYNHMQEAGNYFFRIFISIVGSLRLIEDRSLSLSKLRSK